MAPPISSPSGSASRPDSSTGALVHGAKQGDSARFRELYDRVAPALLAWADLRIPQRLRSVLEPADIVQEVWVRAFRRLRDYDPERSVFRAWLFRIATFVLLEGLRQGGYQRVLQEAGSESTRAFPLHEVPAEATAVSTRVTRDEGLQLFLGQLAHLDATEKRILIYHGLEGLPHAEVGRRLGLSTEAAMKRWQRLLERLRKEPMPDGLLVDE